MWYGRVSYDVLPKIEVYTTVTYGEVWSTNQAVAGAQKPNLTLQCSNAFLPPSVAAACATAKVTSFTFGTENADFPAYERILTDRRERRFVVGSDGSFDVFEKPITFDSYFEHGEDDVTVNIENMTLNPRYNAAIAAVRNSSGQIVCGTATAVAAGCVPWNVFGDLQNGAEAYSYIAPSNGPYQHTFLTENAASLSFNTSPFRNWAGDVSLAWGGEWRKESYTVSADPYGNGVSAATPYTAAYPSDPVLSSSGNNWYAGNFHNGSGAYSVREAFLEMVLPLWDGAHFGKADLNVAGRVTDYSTSGTVETWKAGGTWDTPLEGLRIRGVRSRDIRAPNLSELFAAPQTQIVPVINRATGVNVQVVTETLGNPNLKPERSDNSEVGLVYSPKWLSGFDISFDYFNIDVREAISTLTIQQEEDLCFNGNAQFCSVVSFNGVIGGPVQPTIIVQPFNLASLTTKGFDIEASYRFELRKWGVPGSFLFRGLATHTIDYISNPGIPGQIVQQFAGFNGTNGTAGDPGTPRWKAYLPQSWTVGPATFTFTERLVSAGYINPNYIVCQVSCPAPTVQHPTTNFNSIPGAIYLDAGGSYQWTSTQLYFKVDNLANRRAPPFGSPTIYDFVGRMFRVGVRLDF